MNTRSSGRITHYIAQNANSNPAIGGVYFQSYNSIMVESMKGSNPERVGGSYKIQKVMVENRNDKTLINIAA